MDGFLLGFGFWILGGVVVTVYADLVDGRRILRIRNCLCVNVASAIWGWISLSAFKFVSGMRQEDQMVRDFAGE